MTRSMIRTAVRLAAAGLFGTGLLAGVGLLSGCGVGQSTQTESQQAPVSGVNVGSADGTIQLRDLAIVYEGPEGFPAGGTAALRVRIFNQGKTPIRLVGLDASSVGQAVVSGPSAMPTPTPTPSAPPSPSGSASGSAPPSGSVSASGSASASAPSAGPSGPAGNPRIDIEIPVDGFVALDPSSPRYLALTGLAEEIRPGQQIQVTFRFDNGVTITTPLSTSIPLSGLPRTPMEFEGEG